MKKITDLSKINILCSVFAIIHFFAVFLYCPKYSTDFSASQKVIYFITQILSFVIISGFWNTIPAIINTFKTDNDNNKFFIKCLIFYFLLNIIILSVTYPSGSVDTDFLICYNMIKNYDFYWWVSRIINFDIILGYHFIPAIWGISVFNILLYSTVFGYVITNIRNSISKKYFYLTIIPFCAPAVLIINQAAIRLVLASWIFLFCMFFIYFNRNKQINNTIYAVLFGIITTELIISRFEFLYLIIFIPIILYFLKVFELKRYIYFLSVVIIFSVSNFFLQNLSIDTTDTYLIHNCSYIIETYFSFNPDAKEVKENKKKLESIYPAIYINQQLNTNSKSDISTEERKNLYGVLGNIMSKYHYLYIRKNMLNLIEAAKTNPFPEFDKTLLDKIDIEDKYKIYKDNVSKTNNKNTSLLFYGTKDFSQNKISKHIYNPLINILILVILFIYAIVKKEKFYLFFAAILTVQLAILLLTIPFMRYIYFYCFIFNTWILFFLLITTLSARNGNKNIT